MIKKGDITNDILDFLGEDISDTMWSNLAKHLTLDINEGELARWIEYIKERDDATHS